MTHDQSASAHQKASQIDPARLRPKQGIRARLFARAMAQAGDVHDELIAPYKARLLPQLRGDVLEIGPGNGPNFAYYATAVRWVGVEPNLHMHPYLRANAPTRALDLRTGYTEAIPADDASMDAVVSTLVLCSVQDLDIALAEIRRVLRPGGRYVFIEHVAAPAGSMLRRWQNWLRPAWGCFADGCRPNRELWDNIEHAGFSHVEIEHFKVSVPIVGPHIAGFAIK